MIALIAGPRILVLLPLWLFGVGAHALMRRGVPRPLTGAVLCFAAPAIFVGYEVLAWHGHRLLLLDTTLRKPIMQDYLVSALFAVHLIGFCAISPFVGRSIERFERVIRWAAGATFTIYLFHMPVAQFLTTIVPWPPSSWQTRLVMFPGTIALMFVIAAVTERRKTWWRRMFSAILAPAPVPRAVGDRP